ncbi:conjugal transfer protein TrbN [Acerihabitans sp. TG2]|uniref:conjugal transfer protein TrbN n=1 Tax=Acerihabitans sp. TG2 TaxID=3096008 RepID=UPI002B22B4B3|nr:conjugal transfer protein TrbN [Acerihabitans sp. TG2]MEA9392211.1 conjugal transfer protein TrbN [Acerihabitans sp. TG2]
MKIKLFLFIATLSPSFCNASVSVPFDDFYGVRPATISCVVKASQKQGVPANVLLALSSLERGKNGQFVKNTNGSIDLGHFQINTTNWDKKTGLFAGRLSISHEDVALRGCYNAELAAWLLRQRINEDTGQDYWTRVANYHSKTKQYNDIYKKKLIPLVVQWGKWLQRNRNNELAVTYK